MKTFSAVLGGLLVVACGNQEQSDPTPALAVSALEFPIIDCQSKQATCLLNASDPQAAFSCNQDLGQCLLDSASKVAAFNQGLIGCQLKAQECVINGGLSSVAGCRTAFETCVSGDDDSDAGVTTPGAGGGPGLPGLPGLPGGGGFFPGFPRLPAAGGGGTRGGSPGLGMPGASCLTSLPQCLQAGTSVTDCAAQARKCLAGQNGTPTTQSTPKNPEKP